MLHGWYGEMIDKEFWKNKKVLVTGHTGFKGSWLVRWLNILGADITGYALSPNTCPSMHALLDNGSCVRNNIIADIRDYGTLSMQMSVIEPEIIFHLAAQPLVRESYKDPLTTYTTNIIGTANLLQCAREINSVKAIIIITTDKVYRNKEWIWGYRENDELGGFDPYSCSKACSEMIVESFLDSFFVGRKIVKTARAGNVIGGGDWAVDRLVPDCMKTLSRGEKIIIRNPNAVRPWQHVLEPLYGYLLLAESVYKYGINSVSYNFGPEESSCINVEEVVRTICKLWGKNANFNIKNDAGPHETNYLKLDCTKAKKELNWMPLWNIDEALNKTIEWYKAYYQNKNIELITEKQIEEYMEAV